MEEKEWKIVHADDMADGIGEKLSRFLESFKSPEDDRVWSEQLFQWKIKEAPTGPGFVNLAVSEDNIVGVTSITPKLICYRGKTIKAGELDDCYTDARFQRRGIFAALANDIKTRAHESGYDLIYTVRVKATGPTLEKKCNFVSSPTFKLSTCSYLFNAARLIGQKSRGPVKLFFSVLDSFINSALRTIQWFWLATGKLFRISVKEVMILDERYNELWQKYKHQHDVSQVRDRAYLSYRFFNHPLAKYKFYEATKGEKLLGYLVSRTRIDQGRKNGIIADWLYDRQNPLAFLSLLNLALRKGLSQNVDLYSTWVNSSTVEKWLFLVSGFIFRKHLPVIIHKNDMGSQILNNKDRWHFTIADSDNA